jgi:hypothetical protein
MNLAQRGRYTNEENSKQVIDKMAAAAAALGWPQQVVDVARAQMQAITEMQIKTMAHMIEAWEEQLKLPNPVTASPPTMLPEPTSLSDFRQAGSWLSSDAFQKAAINPLQFWMQFAAYWQSAEIEQGASERQSQEARLERQHQAGDTRRKPQQLFQVVRSEAGNFLCIIPLAKPGLVGLNKLALHLNSFKNDGLITDWHIEGWHDHKTQLRAIVRFDTETDALSAVRVMKRRISFLSLAT